MPAVKPAGASRRHYSHRAAHGKPALGVRDQGSQVEILGLLFGETLIGVTGLFCDPAAWDLLRDRARPSLPDRTSEKVIGGLARAFTDIAAAKGLATQLRAAGGNSG